MLNLIEGGFFSGGHEMIKDRIAMLTENKKRSILIVPEQQTVSAEHEMTDYLPPSAPLCFETTNFTRLSNTVFRALGGLAGESADAAKRSLIMWKAMTELSVLLETTANKGEISAGSVSKMLNTVKQLQSCAITPQDLADTADRISGSGAESNSRLTAKLRDVSKIMTLYKKLLTERYADTDDALLLAAEKLAANPDFLSDHEIFIDGFTSFTEPQYKMLEKLFERANVTIYLALPKNAKDEFEYTELKETHERLLMLAPRASCDVKSNRIDGRNDCSLMISELSSLLWRSNAKIDTDAYKEEDSLHIFEAENPYEECAFVAEDIKRRVMEGAKYSDFGIIARSIESYSGILDTAFEKAKVPLFTAKRSDVGSYEVIKLIYSAFATVSGGYKREDVISYSKCSLSGVERNLADAFELYVENWQISGSRFTDGLFWNMNPAGYTKHRGEGVEDKLLLIDRARQAIITPLVALENDVKAAKTVKELATALVNFLVSLNIEKTLLDRSEEEKALRGSEAAADMARLWGVICEALDSLCEILGDTVVAPETFLSLLKITFSETGIGRIPAYTEQVTAGSADTVRMHGKKYIYIIGANAGVFPPAVNDNAFFTDKDKRALAAAGLQLSADTETVSARELYLFERAISYARVGVNILYSNLDVSFKATPPSEVIKRISDLTDEKILPTVISKLPIMDRAWSAEYALEHIKDFGTDLDDAKEALKESGYDSLISISEAPIKNTTLRLSRESLDLLYGESIKTDQSKIETFAKCPMSYFCKYDLGLSAEERAEFDARNIGTFIHAVLENFFKELKKRGKAISEISDAEKEELILRVSKEYIAACFEGIPETSARIKDTVNKLCRAAKPIIDGLCDEFSNCKYEPTFFELKINKNDKGTPEPIVFKTENGKELYITGKIDRVDTFKSGNDVYIRVVDYKSGNKVFSPDDIKKGMNLQMFLYLKSIVETESENFRKKAGAEEGGKLIPSGVIYVKTSIEDAKISRDDEKLALSEINKNQTRQGMLLDDKTSIEAMNPDYIPVKFKDNGDVDSRYREKLYTLSRWDALNVTIKDVIRELGKRMTTGDISATPMLKSSGKSDACTYCEFKAICRNAHIGK